MLVVNFYKRKEFIMNPYIEEIHVLNGRIKRRNEEIAGWKERLREQYKYADFLYKGQLKLIEEIHRLRENAEKKLFYRSKQ